MKLGVRSVVFLPAVAIAMVGALCGPLSTDAFAASKAASNSGPVAVRLFGDWEQGLNPYNPVANINSIILDTGVYDRLVALSPTSGKVVPYLATSWQVSPTKLVFKIRKGVTCSDGSSLGPTQVAQALNYLTTFSLAKQLLGPGPWTITSDASAGTVTVTLGTPFSTALFDLTSPHASIVCPAEITLAKAGNTTQAVGSGAYTITSAVHTSVIDLKARSSWTWGPNGESAKKAGFISTLTLPVVANTTTAANELLTGELSVGSFSGTNVSRLLAKKSLTHSTYGGSFLSELIFNNTNPVTQTVKVREAIFRAINTKTFLQADLGGYGVTGKTFLAPDAPCYDKSAKTAGKPSVKTAESILESAGYTMVGGKMTKNGQPLALNLLTTLSDFPGSGAAYISDALGAVGITVSVTTVSAATYGSDIVKGVFGIALEFVSGGGPAPGNYALYFNGPSYSQGGTNPGIVDPTVTSLITAAESATGSSQCVAWGKVQQQVLSDYDELPMDQQTKEYFTQGIKMTPLTAVSLDSLHR